MSNKYVPIVIDTTDSDKIIAIDSSSTNLAFYGNTLSSINTLTVENINNGSNVLNITSDLKTQLISTTNSDNLVSIGNAGDISSRKINSDTKIGSIVLDISNKYVSGLNNNGDRALILLDVVNSGSKNTSGIHWKPNFTNYIKTSAFLHFEPVTGGYFTGDLVFGTSPKTSSGSAADANTAIERLRITHEGTIEFPENNNMTRTTVTDTTKLIPRFYHKITGEEDIYVIADYWAKRGTPHNGGTILRNFTCLRLKGYINFCYYGWQLLTGQNVPYQQNFSNPIEFGTSGTDETLAYLKMSVNTEYQSNHIFDASAYTLNFTGQHRCIPDNQELFNNIDNYIGLIVCSSGKYKSYNVLTKQLLKNKSGILINESLPIIKLSNKKKQKNVFGVISNKEDVREYGAGAFITKYPTINDEPRLYINSLGEGAIWIVNTNGNLENGDYIQSSDVIGLGEKQNSEFLANYTVAKITCDCEFILNSEDYNCEEFVDSVSGNTYRKAFVGCTYHCG